MQVRLCTPKHGNHFLNLELHYRPVRPCTPLYGLLRVNTTCYYYQKTRENVVNRNFRDGLISRSRGPCGRRAQYLQQRPSARFNKPHLLDAPQCGVDDEP
jgi:hypothetical protein